MTEIWKAVITKMIHFIIWYIRDIIGLLHVLFILSLRGLILEFAILIIIVFIVVVCFFSDRTNFNYDGGLRPVITLKSNIKIVSGNGKSPETAYQIIM